MCQIFSVHIFIYVENFSRFFFFFFLPLYRVIKKVKARCVKQKSDSRGGPASVSDSADSGSEGRKEGAASSSRSLSVSGILLWREGKRRKRAVDGGRGGVWGVVVVVVVVVSEVSTTSPPPLRSPSLSLPKRSSLALRLADSASFLSVLLLHTNRRNRSRGWSAPPRRRWRSCQRIPQNRTSISS